MCTHRPPPPLHPGHLEEQMWPRRFLEDRPVPPSLHSATLEGCPDTISPPPQECRNSHPDRVPSGTRASQGFATFQESQASRGVG